MLNPWDWTKTDLEQLLNQAESLRLDFKQSRLFDGDRNKIIEVLTKEVSAFANTEGGTIVIGIEEEKRGRTRFATALDHGIDITQWSPEWIQQTIEANVRPYLTGLRIRPIPLDSSRNRCAISIWVPQGTTAYQASDYKYYGRSEYESKPLPDHEIRLRMLRGKTPQAAIVLEQISTGEKLWSIKDNKQRIIDELGYEEDEVERLPEDTTFNVRYFRLAISVANVGEVNINEFKSRLILKPLGIHNIYTDPIEMAVKDGWIKSFALGPFSPEPGQLKVNIFPRDHYRVHDLVFWLQEVQELSDVGLTIEWTLYLRDSLPFEGVIDVIDAIQREPNIQRNQ